jgi:hypothetical protein
LHGFRRKPFLHEKSNTILAWRAGFSGMEAKKIAHANTPPEVAEIVNGDAVGVRGAEQCSDAGSHDRRNRNVLLLQYFENSQMREAAGETAAESQSDSTLKICAWNTALRSACSAFATSLRSAVGRHEASLARRSAANNEAEVLKFRYSRTLSQSLHKIVPQRLTVLLSYEIVASVPL